jgi:hypothetical protein
MNHSLRFRISVLLGLVVSYLATLICHKDLSKMTELIKDDNDLKTYYDEIKKQRRINCLIGCGVGFFFCLLFLVLFKTDWKNRFVNLGIIFFLTPMVIYNLLPNKKYFLEASLYGIDLSEEQVVQWFQIYKCMQKSMIIGFLGSFFLIYLLLFSLSKKSLK